jgi:DNA-binding CsgD family transcriptional regulator
MMGVEQGDHVVQPGVVTAAGTMQLCGEPDGVLLLDRHLASGQPDGDSRDVFVDQDRGALTHRTQDQGEERWCGHPADILVGKAVPHDRIVLKGASQDVACPGKVRSSSATDLGTARRAAVGHGRQVTTVHRGRPDCDPSARPQYDHGVLAGRDRESAELRTLLDSVHASRSAVLVLRGEAGVGKSALLLELIRQAEDLQCLRVVGVESESTLAFAGLHQLSWSLLAYVDEIPTPQADALKAALGLVTRSVSDRFLIGAATLSLLAAASEKQPVLCLVDDAHWLDQPSADALTFAARRLHAEPIAMVFATREGDVRRFDASGLPELTVRGLDRAAAAELLEMRAGRELPLPVRDQLLDRAAGNPLALTEVAGALTRDQALGLAPLDEGLATARSVTDIFLTKVRGLTLPSQEVALITAADDTGDLAIVLRAASTLGIGPDGLDPLEESGLVLISGGKITFRHPLIRSAIYQAAGFRRRQRVHDALAGALDLDRYEDRRLWHRAAATVGTDDKLAEDLELSADRAQRRSGHSAAAAALHRAAALTTDDRTRARRLTAAARTSWLGGRPGPARALLEEAVQLADDAGALADATHLQALMELQHGSPAAAHDLLMHASADAGALDPRKTAEMLVAAGEAANFAGDLVAEITAGRRAERLRATLGPGHFELTMMAGVANLLEGDVSTAARLLTDSIAEAELSGNPRRFSWAGSAAFYLGDVALAHSFWTRSADEARSQGAIAMLAVALQYVALSELLIGRSASATMHSTEGLQLATETDQDNCAAFHLALMAWGASRSGDESECRERAARALDAAVARGLGIQAATATLALGELELSLGRPVESLAHLDLLWTAGPGTTSISIKLIAVPTLVEAAARAGRWETARSALAFYEDWTTNTGSRAELPLLSRCRGIAADDEGFEHFEEALHRHADLDRPFERARTELVFGAALRRSRQRLAAREHLRSAVDLFDHLGAAGWSASAQAELRATGETARVRDESTLTRLTPQELQIARLVAVGASNKSAAAQLFLSPRTIDYHLRNVFMKLGISSRTQLAGLPLGL